LEGDVAAKLLNAVLSQPRMKRLLSSDHFSVDGTLIEALASMKSFKPKAGADEPQPVGGGRNRETDFHGETRSNDTYASTTHPEARLYRQGAGQGGQAVLHGVRIDGEPQRSHRRCLRSPSRRACRADCSLHMIEPRAGHPLHRQGLRR
jgi:hypothetical protein